MDEILKQRDELYISIVDEKHIDNFPGTTKNSKMKPRSKISKISFNTELI